jgi:DNA polymerase-3 subunit epsilon
MLLEFERPIVAFDVETTGTSFERDRIVQVGLIKMYPGGEMNEWETLINPGIPIPSEATEVHGIDDEAVREAPTFRDKAAIIIQGFRDRSS